MADMSADSLEKMLAFAQIGEEINEKLLAEIEEKVPDYHERMAIMLTVAHRLADQVFGQTVCQMDARCAKKAIKMHIDSLTEDFL